MPNNFTDVDVGDQSGRVFLVTGANTGLGFEATKVLSQKGGRVFMGCRSEAKANAAIDAIKSENPGADVQFLSIDLADLASVKSAAIQMQQESRLDVLINNAGIMFPPLEYTQDEFESQFGVNHLGTFALTCLLLTKLAETEGSRVVTTSSLAHTVNAEISFDDIDAKKNYNKFKRYNQSKLANILFMLELDRRLKASGSPVISTGCHPGIAETELGRHMSKLVQMLFLPFRPLFNTPAKGAWPTLAAAVGDGVKGGDYFGPEGFNEWRGKAGDAKIHPTGRDTDLASRLWALSIEMTGIDPGI